MQKWNGRCVAPAQQLWRAAAGLRIRTHDHFAKGKSMQGV